MNQRYSARDIIVLVAVAALFLFQSGVGGLDDLIRGPRIWNIVGLLLGITVHEASHALAAVKLGDPTPKLMGRLSLNPIRHYDPIGTTMILLGAPFGWGKPVTFNPLNLKVDPLLGSSIVSVAGPLANIVTAFLLAQPLRAGVAMDPTIAGGLHYIATVNIYLAAFNLVPIPPLDGFGFVTGLLPKSVNILLQPLRQYGPFLLLFLVFLPLLGGPRILFAIMSPLAAGLMQLVGLA